MTSDLRGPDAVTVDRAETPDDLDAVRGLVRDFFRWAMAELAQQADADIDVQTPPAFATLDAELAGLPGRFAPPSGCPLLGRLNGAPAGCVVFSGQDVTTMEIKRMFVRPEAWGRGIGGRMLDLLLAEARAGRIRPLSSVHPSQASRGSGPLPSRRVPRGARLAEFPRHRGGRRHLHGNDPDPRHLTGEPSCPI